MSRLKEIDEKIDELIMEKRKEIERYVKLFNNNFIKRVKNMFNVECYAEVWEDFEDPTHIRVALRVKSPHEGRSNDYLEVYYADARLANKIRDYVVTNYPELKDYIFVFVEGHSKFEYHKQNALMQGKLLI